MPRAPVRGKKKPSRRKESCALLRVDNRPLQREAWKRLVDARARLERLHQQIRQFEEEDVPAFRRWLHGQFPALVSAIREAALQVFTKNSLIEGVRREARLTGQTAAAVWARRKRGESAAAEESYDADAATRPDAERWDGEDDEDEDDEEWDDFMRSHGLDPDADDPGLAREARKHRADSPEEEGSPDIKQVYRRLVQRLHPDNGGHWDERRAELWHQVQQAWAERDEALLTRLADQLDGDDGLSVNSGVSELRNATRRASRARWGAEQTLRAYRMRREWRFSTRQATDLEHRRQQQELDYELTRLRAQLSTARDTLERWEELGKLQASRSGLRSRRRAS